MNKKSLFFALVYVIFAVAVCFSAGCAANGFIKNDYGVYKNADEYFIGDKTYFNDGGITSVNVDWLSGKVKIKHGENFEIKEVFSGLSEAKKVRSAVIDGELKIKFWKSGYSDTCDKSIGEKDVEITIPSGIDLILNGTDCAFCAESLNLKKLNVGLIAGGFSSEEIVCESLKTSFTSASFSVVNAEVLTTAELSSISGEQKIGEFGGKSLTIESTSGDVNVGIKKCDEFDVDTISGNVAINLGKNGATVGFSTISGKFKSDSQYAESGEKYVFGDGACKITVETTSGSLTIK